MFAIEAIQTIKTKSFVYFVCYKDAEKGKNDVRKYDKWNKVDVIKRIIFF